MAGPVPWRGTGSAPSGALADSRTVGERALIEHQTRRAIDPMGSSRYRGSMPDEVASIKRWGQQTISFALSIQQPWTEGDLQAASRLRAETHSVCEEIWNRTYLRDRDIGAFVRAVFDFAFAHIPRDSE